MIDEKSWYRSRAIWGGLVALAASLAGAFGAGLDPQAQETLAGALTDLAAAIGAALAILGRLRARTVIGR